MTREPQRQMPRNAERHRDRRPGLVSAPFRFLFDLIVIAGAQNRARNTKLTQTLSTASFDAKCGTSRHCKQR